MLVSARVPASPARAFEAFTAEIGRWWTPNGLFPFTDDPDGTLEFTGDGAERSLLYRNTDGSVFEVGRVLRWEPPELLVVTWREATFPDDVTTELHVRFEGLADGLTRVTVEHFGWDRLDIAHAARHGFPLGPFQQRFAEWWQGLLAGLSDHVEPRQANRY